MQIKAPRGTYDILPADSFKWQFIEKIMRDIAERFGYQEIRTPLFEHTELFERGVGESTDIVTKEMYTFYDRSNRSLTLRPEGTASCVRSFIEHGLYNGLLPVKWYYTGPMFRYDRPQTGRYRQFHQFGVEALGSNNPYLDAEIIIMLVEMLAGLGILDYELHLNSVGCPECRKNYREQLIGFIAPKKEQLCSDCQVRYIQNPLRVLDCKNKNCKASIEGYPTLYDHLCEYCGQHYLTVQKVLQENGISFIHDDSLVRGLDYYTNTAFEVHIPEIGAQSAIGGGGRYDGLIKECGGPNLPGIGFALGLERVLLAMETSSSVDMEMPKGTDVFVACVNQEYENMVFSTLIKLRKSGLKAEKDYSHRTARAQMKYADKLGAKAVVLIGEEEAEKNMFTVRNMRTGEQTMVNSDDLLIILRKLLAAD
ncbi:MAG: histidine--tRNA ligase [Syntrophomonadaceae bacterium]